jgi:hypothetical protein
MNNPRFGLAARGRTKFNGDWRTPVETLMPTSTRSDVKSTGSRTASGFPPMSATFKALCHGSSENRATQIGYPIGAARNVCRCVCLFCRSVRCP